MHSQQAWWNEAQKSVGRVGVMHDVGVEIGEWGDEHWAAWIISRIKPGQEIYSCESGHLGQALEDITCHYPKREAESWIAWWQTNQNKSQVDWIKGGFAEFGVKIENPLTTNNIIDLLNLACQPTNSVISTNHIGWSVRKNAFRWLRDSGLNPNTILEIWNHDVNNIPADAGKRTVLALIYYAQWYGDNWDGPGKLPIQQSFNWNIPHEHETMLNQWRKYLDYGIPMLAVVGFFLLRRQPPR